MSFGKVGTLVSLAMLISSSFSSPPSCGRHHGICVAPWKEWGGTCYRITREALTYDDARDACRRLGGTMAAPRSDQENDLLSSLAQGSHIWVACTDRKQEGEWECDGGSQDGAGSYTNWREGEPNSYFESENCVFLQPSYGNIWNDVSCENQVQAVCKRQPLGSCFAANNEGRLEMDSCP